MNTERSWVGGEWQGRSNSLLDLDSTRIDLWLTRYDAIEDGVVLSAYQSLLSDEEVRQEARFYFRRDRRRYLVTRALVRTVLSRYCALAEDAWMFTQNQYGRPQIANKLPDGCSVSFSISHTESMIVLGVSRRAALGVDIENTHIREAPIAVAERFFAPFEVKALEGIPQAARAGRFWEYWTFKESYIKARGMGLSLPLDGFSFHFSDDTSVEIKIEPALADDAASWQFWQLRPDGDYLLAICAARAPSRPQALRVRKTIPLVSEELVDLAVARRSM